MFDILSYRSSTLVQDNEDIFSKFVDRFTFYSLLERNTSRNFPSGNACSFPLSCETRTCHFYIALFAKKYVRRKVKQNGYWKSSPPMNGRAIMNVRNGAVGIVPNGWFVVFSTLDLDDVSSEYFSNRNGKVNGKNGTKPSSRKKERKRMKIVCVEHFSF